MCEFFDKVPTPQLYSARKVKKPMMHLSPKPQRMLAPYLHDGHLITAGIEAIQQGVLDAYNLGSTNRTALSVGSYGHSQVMHHLANRLCDPAYVSGELGESASPFTFTKRSNQVRITHDDRYSEPVRILGRKGKPMRGFFEVSTLGNLTVEMLLIDHERFRPVQAHLFGEDEQTWFDGKYQDLIFVYDYAFVRGRLPLLAIYLVFPLSPYRCCTKLPYVDFELLWSGELGPDAPSWNKPNPIFPVEGTPVIDFDIPAKKAA